MEEVKLISFRDINPFVRHVHLSRIEPTLHRIKIRAYDHRLIYVYDGKGFFLFDNIKYRVSKGSLLFWQSGTEYLILSDESDCMSVIGVNFDFTSDRNDINYPVPPERSQDFKNNYVLERICFKDTEFFNNIIFIKNCQALESTLLEMKNEYSIRKNYYETKINGLFLTLLADIARYMNSPSTIGNDDENLTDRVIKFICKNYTNPITNKDISAHFNYHTNYINRMMVLNTGTSLRQYLINYRISKAIQLLKTTQKPITEIAYEVGFKDPNHFSKTFKKKVGVSPKEYAERTMGLI